MPLDKKNNKVEFAKTKETNHLSVHPISAFPDDVDTKEKVSNNLNNEEFFSPVEDIPTPPVLLSPVLHHHLLCSLFCAIVEQIQMDIATRLRNLLLNACCAIISPTGLPDILTFSWSYQHI